MISAFNYSAPTILFLISNRWHRLALATPNNSCCFDFQHLVDGHILQAWLFGWTAAWYNQGIKWLSGLLLDQMHHRGYKKAWQKKPWWYTLHTHTRTETHTHMLAHTLQSVSLVNWKWAFQFSPKVSQAVWLSVQSACAILCIVGFLTEGLPPPNDGPVCAWAIPPWPSSCLSLAGWGPLWGPGS